MDHLFLRVLFKGLPLLLGLLFIHSLFVIEPLNQITLNYFYSFSWLQIVIPYLGVLIYSCYYANLEFFVEVITLPITLSKEEIIKELTIKNDFDISIISSNMFMISKVEGISCYRVIINFPSHNLIQIEGHTHLIRLLQKKLGIQNPMKSESTGNT